MSEQSVWDDPDLQDGDYYTFKDVPNGTSVSGVICKISTTEFDGKTVPVLTLKDDVTGEDKILTAGAFRLKALFIAKRPRLGDHVKVTQTGEEPIGGGKKVKDWTVDVTPVGTPAPVVAAAPVVAQVSVPVAAPAAALPVDPAAAAAALANLTPEQRVALGLPV